jgi:tRNA A-37 threonylcarbamoyl transferase component Bud32
MVVGGEGLHVVRHWADRLHEAGLDSFDGLYHASRGRVASRHDRGWIRRVTLPGGEVVFVKCDAFSTVKQIAMDLLRGRRPEPLSEKYRQGIARVRALGIAAPQAIAWGQRRRLGLPWRGVLMMTRLPGRALKEYLAANPEPEARRSVLASVGRALRALYGARLSWPDLRAKHVYVDEGERIGLMDLDRLEPCRNVRRRMPAQLRRFCRELREFGADEGELAAMMEALEHPHVVDPG